MLLFTFILHLAAVGYGKPLVLRSDEVGPPANATFVRCTEGTTDPLCHLVRQPTLGVVTEITHINGTKETKRDLYTHEHLRGIRERNNVTSVERKLGQTFPDNHAKFINEFTKRESSTGIPICYTERMKWFDQHEWGYWYQQWKQVGNCFYCDQCTEAISTSFAVAQTWSFGLEAKFAEVITASFHFSWGQTYSLSDTRTCQWNYVENGCHSIWYQPLMSYHNGYANLQTHTHCYGPSFSGGGDSYYDHDYHYVNVNQAGNNGVNQGNLGCNSGCQGGDHRQCQNGNNGGALWPYAN